MASPDLVVSVAGIHIQTPSGEDNQPRYDGEASRKEEKYGSKFV
jgi:hypothetical protein